MVQRTALRRCQCFGIVRETGEHRPETTGIVGIDVDRRSPAGLPQPAATGGDDRGAARHGLQDDEWERVFEVRGHCHHIGVPVKPPKRLSINEGDELEVQAGVDGGRTQRSLIVGEALLRVA